MADGEALVPVGDAAETAVVDSEAAKPKTEKPVSVVGYSLSKSDIAKSSPTSPARTTWKKGESTSRISHKYSVEATTTENERHWGLVPLAQRAEIPPCEREVARSVKKDLDLLQQKAGGGPVAWDALFNSDHFLKRMEFLCGHAKNGTFTEEYGPDSRYEGEFVNGLRHGRGKHEYKGEVYDGFWKWDQRDGPGVHTAGDGSKTSGTWVAGQLSGFVTIQDGKGQIVYQGEFKDGKRHGLGRQVFTSGDVYDGGWQNGKLHERGVYYFTNGDKLMGMWKEGLYDGVGVFYYADGSISRREYKGGLLMSVQDYEKASKKFGKTITRNNMQKNTQDRDFPKEVFLLSSA